MEGFMVNTKQILKTALVSLCALSLQAAAADSTMVCPMAAKDSACLKKETFHYGFAAIGPAWFTNFNLNQHLRSMNLSSFRDYAVSVGLGDHREKGKEITESSITVDLWPDNVNANVRSSMASIELVSNSGHNFMPEKSAFSLFPYCGLNAGFSMLHIRPDVQSLSENLSSTQTNAMVWQGALLGTLGLGSDVKISCPEKKGGLVIGLRTGWCYDLYTMKNWQSNGTAISGLPGLRHNGGYVKLIIGGWAPGASGMKKQCCMGEKS